MNKCSTFSVSEGLIAAPDCDKQVSNSSVSGWAVLPCQHHWAVPHHSCGPVWGLWQPWGGAAVWPETNVPAPWSQGGHTGTTLPPPLVCPRHLDNNDDEWLWPLWYIWYWPNDVKNVKTEHCIGWYTFKPNQKKAISIPILTSKKN